MNKDNITKKLFEDKEVFASFINGVIYQGKKILSSHHLKEVNLYGIPGRIVLKEIQRESQTQRKTTADHQCGVLYRERGMETVKKSV